MNEALFEKLLEEEKCKLCSHLKVIHGKNGCDAWIEGKRDEYLRCGCIQ